jgi:uncharacterized membrane protein YsdA (DUF1294 family)/cold shock CspA family protein
VRVEGKIAFWNEEKGFGFIDPSGVGPQVFVHIKAFRNRAQRPEIDQFLTYVLSADAQGRPCAEQAVLAGDPLSQNTKHNGATLSILVSASFLVLVVAAALSAKIPPYILVLYLVGSPLTYIVYALDKSAAKKGAWRTPEKTLHFLALLGGWPGALVAQQMLRHKSQKQSFRTVFWLTVFLNCAALIWLSTPTGAATLQSWIDNIA